MPWDTQIVRGISFSDLETLRTAAVRDCQRSRHRKLLILAEPTPTFTCGRQSQPQDLLWTPAQRAQLGVQVYPVSRGGQWTYHGPGQMLVYPVAALSEICGSSRQVSKYLQMFRETLLSLLIHEMGVSAHTEDRPFGLYVDTAKLVSFGICVERGIVSHGAALYGTDQRKYFAGIRGCATHNLTVTSLEQLDRPFDFTGVASAIHRLMNITFFDAKK